MSEAISGAWLAVCNPACRFAHAGYLLRPHPPPIHIERLAGHGGSVVAGEKRQGARPDRPDLDALDRLQAGDGAEFLIHVGEARARLSHRCSPRTGQQVYPDWVKRGGPSRCRGFRWRSIRATLQTHHR
jgi:hypothetical protein